MVHLLVCWNRNLFQTPARWEARAARAPSAKQQAGDAFAGNLLPTDTAKFEGFRAEKCEVAPPTASTS